MEEMSHQMDMELRRMNRHPYSEGQARSKENNFNVEEDGTEIAENS